MFLCAVLLSGSVWCHRQAYTVGPWPAGPLHQICEGAVRDRTKLRQAAQVWSFWMFIHFYMKWDLEFIFCVCSYPMHASQVDVFTLFQQKSHKEICQTRKQGRSRLQVRKQKLVSSSSLSCIVTFLHFSSYFFYLYITFSWFLRFFWYNL